MLSVDILYVFTEITAYCLTENNLICVKLYGFDAQYRYKGQQRQQRKALNPKMTHSSWLSVPLR